LNARREREKKSGCKVVTSGNDLARPAAGEEGETIEQMKQVWKVIKYTLIVVAVLFLWLLASLIPDYVYYMPRAKPSQSVTNLQSFFEWKPEPKWAWKVTVSNSVYYQLSGPAGRSLASGPSAYAFDASGRYIGWTADSGDFFTPKIIYASGAKRERISASESALMRFAP